MDVPQLSPELREALRTWFHSKDRSVYLADNTFAYLPGGVGYLSVAFISETILNASVASVTFSNISQDFRHLVLTGQVKTDRAAEVDGIITRFNGDSSASYDVQIFNANATVLGGNVQRATNGPVGGICEAASSRGNNFSFFYATILSYSISMGEKNSFLFSSVFGNSDADTDFIESVRALRWRNTNVIVSINLTPQLGTNFVSGSRFQLYGIL